jgi:hypothetical protein
MIYLFLSAFCIFLTHLTFSTHYSQGIRGIRTIERELENIRYDIKQHNTKSHL